MTTKTVPATVVEILQTEAQLIIDNGWIGQAQRRHRTNGGQTGLDLREAACMAIADTRDPDDLDADQHEIFEEVIESIEAKLGMTVEEFVDTHINEGAMSIALDLEALAWEFEQELDPS